MAWHWESNCSVCAFISRQLGPGTPCPSHAGRWSVRPSGEPSSLAGPLPRADCPWPFTLHQYVRLLALRGGIREEHASLVQPEGLGEPAHRHGVGMTPRERSDTL